MSGEDKNKAKGKKKKKLSYEWRRIDYFYELFNEEGASEDLWEMLKLALTNDEEETEGRERSNMLFLYEYTKELYENIYILLLKEKEKSSKK